jgi:zinc and cadmium transporter
MDGLIIGASYAASIPLGITSSVAILLHEVPQEIGDFGVLVHGGLTPRKALLYNVGISLTAVVGTVVALAIGTRATGLVDVLLPIAAGGFVYIAGSDLIPELKTRALPSRAAAELALMLLGIGVMLLLTVLE